MNSVNLNYKVSGCLTGLISFMVNCWLFRNPEERLGEIVRERVQDWENFE